MLALMDSRELSGFYALLRVHEVEQEEAAEAARMKADSDDGEVVTYGRPQREFDDDDEPDEVEPDGPPD